MGTVVDVYNDDESEQTRTVFFSLLFLMGKFEMKQIVSWIDLAIKSYDNESVLLNIKQKVKDLCSSFPIYDH